MTAPQLGKINFAGMVGAKRRRMRSGGNVSTLPGPSANNNNTNNNTNSSSNNNNNDDPAKSDDPDMSLDSDDEKTTQTSKCKGATTIPIFLKSKLSPKLSFCGVRKGGKRRFSRNHHGHKKRPTAWISLHSKYLLPLS
jgi:hypothetical protein